MASSLQFLQEGISLARVQESCKIKGESTIILQKISCKFNFARKLQGLARKLCMGYLMPRAERMLGELVLADT